MKERRQQAKEIRGAEEARRRAEQELRVVEQLTDFEETYALGAAASKRTLLFYTLQ